MPVHADELRGTLLHRMDGSASDHYNEPEGADTLLERR
jgi:hypothetical protein